MPKVKMTAAFPKSVKAPATGMDEYVDADTSGLCLRVFPNGRSSWSYRYRAKDSGKVQRVTLGPSEALPLAAARDRAKRLAVQVLDGEDPQARREAAKSVARNVLTFDALAEGYLAAAKVNKSSWKNDEGYLRRPQAAWGKKPAKVITRQMVVALLDSIKQTAPVSANRTHSILSVMFNWGIEEELVETNPIAGMKKRHKGEKPKERVLNEAELAVLWKALEAPRTLSRNVADALRLCLLTGLRPGEVAGLTRDEVVAIVRADEARLEIPAIRMKARKAHVVPLPPLARGLVDDALRRSNEAAVFPSDFIARETIARHSLSQGLKREIERLEGEDAESLKANPPTPHDLRRTCATHLAALGVLREDRLAVLAHTAGDVHGAHYDKYERLKEKRAALSNWEAKLASIVTAAKP